MGITVNIDKTGKATVEANGVVGSGCEQLTRPMEEALGMDTEDRQYKPEYHQHAEQQQHEGM